MAKDNRLLGQFNLEGIPAAPRGTPRIEVKFDIDANGILSVNAKDLGSNKEQSVTIEQSSGLNEGWKMRKDAELHAEEDKQKRLAEVRNRSEAACFQTEKLMKENEEKLSDTDKAPLEAAIAKAREAAKGEDADAIQSAHDALEQASRKVLYESQAADAAGGEQAGGEPAAQQRTTLLMPSLKSTRRRVNHVIGGSGAPPIVFRGVQSGKNIDGVAAR